MSKLLRDIKEGVKSGASIRATVVDIFFGRASVRLVDNGQVLRNLDVIGGPVAVGATVMVDFTTPKPTVVATGQSGLSLSDVRDLLNSADALGSGGTTQITITLFSGGAVTAMYPPSSDGLTTALSEANSGDVILLPDIDVEVDITVPAGVDLTGISTRNSIIRGEVTLENGCLLEGLTIRHCEDSESNIVAVVAPSGTARIRNCEIHCYQCGSGSAVGVSIPATNDLMLVEHSKVVANSQSGSAYAFSSAGGTCQVTHCELYGKTDIFYEA